MRRMLDIQWRRIRRTAPVIFSSLLVSSFLFAESRVIIEGNSSIIIESPSTNTRLLTDKIETKSGGKIIHMSSSVTTNTSNIESLPQKFMIKEAYPNPFNPTTTIKYGIDKSSNVEINIYDMTGKLVKNHSIHDRQSGWHQFTWSGKDNNNQNVATGVYLITMRAGENFQNQKVTFLK